MTTIATSTAPHNVLLGVMTSPHNSRLRTQQREWAARFANASVDFKFIMGKNYWNASGVPSSAARAARAVVKKRRQGATGLPAEQVRDEVARNADVHFVDGREGLPHVGLVTEKSAAFWRTAATTWPSYRWYCKSDDDTLVHLQRLGEALLQTSASIGEATPAYFGHIKWRGWNGGDRFQACGGGWGDAAKTVDDVLRGGVTPQGRYPPCPYAEGPQPPRSRTRAFAAHRLPRIAT